MPKSEGVLTSFLPKQYRDDRVERYAHGKVKQKMVGYNDHLRNLRPVLKQEAQSHRGILCPKDAKKFDQKHTDSLQKRPASKKFSTETLLEYFKLLSLGKSESDDRQNLYINWTLLHF